MIVKLLNSPLLASPEQRMKLIACTLLLFVGAASAAPAANKAPPKPACATARGKSPVKIESQCLRIEHEGATRTYRLYKPKSKTQPPAKATQSPRPLLLVLHGGDGSGSGMEALTLGQFNRIADKFGVFVAYPDGVGRSWNDNRTDMNTQGVKADVNDVDFLRTLVARISAQHQINAKRIYVTGISTGGFMAFRLAGEAADTITAIAPVAASLPVELARECRPPRMISIAMINGTDDPMMPWLGGDIKVLGTRRGQVLSTQESFEHWAKFGDCAIPTTHMQRDKVPEDGTSLVRHVARECKNNSEIRLYEMLGGGHTWPSGHPYLGQRTIGRVSRELNASEEIWNFLSRYSLP